MSTLGLGSIAPDMTTTPELTLADVLSRGVVVEWFEAVAVVRATMDELGSGTEQRSTPDLGQVWLTQAGAIHLSGGSYDDQPVRRLGQLLQALLTQADPPVTLKLVVGNATAAVPIYAGLRELDGALAYFERPDRPAVLRGLYARAEVRQAVSASHSLRSVDDVAPLTARSSRQAPKLTRSARRIVTALLIAVVTIGAASLVVRAYRQGERFPVGRITVAAQRVTDTLGGAVLSGISAVTERAGLGRLTPRTPAAAENPRTDPKSAASRHARGRSLLKTTETIQAFDLGKDIALPASVSPLLIASVADGVPTETGRKDASPAVIADTSVYSADSADVVPPTAIRPQFPRVLPKNISASDLSRIEVIVLQDGSVESVKLVAGSRPSTVKDAMLLSAAKAWRFAPATKSGVPVRYRKTIWIVAE
ncbi:MAG TPA: energy transducer TonB [Vicinamibacterales bacterium]|nr:energy transducer TonB [Vicinamibacterales bacterium]